MCNRVGWIQEGVAAGVAVEASSGRGTSRGTGEGAVAVRAETGVLVPVMVGVRTEG